MKKSIINLIEINVAFVSLSVLSSFLGTQGLPVISKIVYYAAFLIPLAGFFALIFRDASAKSIPAIIPEKEKLFLSLVPLFPTLFVVVGLSFAMTELLDALGAKGASAPLEGPMPYLILVYAILPAVLEELLFRLVPMTLLAPYSRKSAVVLSAVLFALAHGSVVEIPYALIAGAVYMCADILAGSILPSVIMHFTNNLASIIWQTVIYGTGYEWIFFAALSALAVASVAFMFVLKRKYREHLAFLADKADKIAFDPMFAVYSAILFIFAVVAIF